jgi:hypothetical protein
MSGQADACMVGFDFGTLSGRAHENIDALFDRYQNVHNHQAQGAPS